LVKQLSINQEAYKFWKSLGEVNTETGSLLSKQPYQIRSNVKNINDGDEPVLGYFVVAGMAKKRIYVNRPIELNFYYLEKCNLITEELRTILMTMQNQWPVKLAASTGEFACGRFLSPSSSSPLPGSGSGQIPWNMPMS